MPWHTIQNISNTNNMSYLLCIHHALICPKLPLFVNDLLGLSPGCPLSTLQHLHIPLLLLKSEQNHPTDSGMMTSPAGICWIRLFCYDCICSNTSLYFESNGIWICILVLKDCYDSAWLYKDCTVCLSRVCSLRKTCRKRHAAI